MFDRYYPNLASKGLGYALQTCGSDSTREPSELLQ